MKKTNKINLNYSGMFGSEIAIAKADQGHIFFISPEHGVYYEYGQKVDIEKVLPTMEEKKYYTSRSRMSGASVFSGDYNFMKIGTYRTDTSRYIKRSINIGNEDVKVLVYFPITSHSMAFEYPAIISLQTPRKDIVVQCSIKNLIELLSKIFKAINSGTEDFSDFDNFNNFKSQEITNPYLVLNSDSDCFGEKEYSSEKKEYSYTLFTEKGLEKRIDTTRFTLFCWINESNVVQNWHYDTTFNDYYDTTKFGSDSDYSDEYVTLVMKFYNIRYHESSSNFFRIGKYEELAQQYDDFQEVRIMHCPLDEGNLGVDQDVDIFVNGCKRLYILKTEDMLKGIEGIEDEVKESLPKIYEYHLNTREVLGSFFMSEKDFFEIAYTEIGKKLIEDIQQRKDDIYFRTPIEDLLREIPFLNLKDSLDCGNCQSGTMNFINKYGFFLYDPARGSDKLPNGSENFWMKTEDILNHPQKDDILENSQFQRVVRNVYKKLKSS